MILASLTTAAILAYCASTVLPYRGLHEYLIKGTIFKGLDDFLYLTFDDGPDPERTPAILDILAANQVKATFFVMGEKAKQYPNIIQRMVDEGHTVANHSWSHPWMPKCSTETILKELTLCQNTIAEIINQRPRFVRPPYGSRDFRFNRIAKKLNLTPVLWTKSTHDWAGVSTAKVEQQLFHAKEKDIILLHDGNSNAIGTIPALQNCLAKLNSRIEFAAM